MQIPLLNGVFSDEASDFRTSYPRNMVPVPKATGIAQGYIRSAGGVAAYSANVTFLPGVPPNFVGPDRGAILWNGIQYRVLGNTLYQVNADNTIVGVAVIPGTGQVTLDYSFDVLGIAADGKLFFWDGAVLTQNVDTDLGIVLDMMWLGGYFMTTDGENLVVTELTDRYAVNPLKYGSSEFDPDPVKSVMKLRNEAYALNRFTIQVFQNVGGNGFPFQLIQGALITRGVIGTHALDALGGGIAFIGGGRTQNGPEQPSVWIAGSGETTKLATREIEVLLRSFTEAQLSQVLCETREHDGHIHFYLHLPTITAVYDLAASREAGEPVWFFLSSSVTADGAYNYRNFVFAYDRWFCGSALLSGGVGLVDESRADGGWQFDTQFIYNEGRGFIIHELELVPLAGRPAPSGSSNFTDWKIAVQYTLDGLTWSQKKFASIGKAGEYLKRVQWRKVASARHRNWIGLRFSGQQPVPIAFARLEARIEPLAA